MLGDHGRFIAKAVFTPLAQVLARTGAAPNMVTVAGTVATVAVAVICIPQGWVWQGDVVLAVVMFGNSMDGMLARMVTDDMRFGAFLDSTLDRLGDGAVFGSPTAYAVFRMDDSFMHTWTIITGICSIVDATTVPYARARAESIGIIAKLGITEHTNRLIIDMGMAILVSLGLPEWIFATSLTWMALAPFVTACQRIWFIAHNIDEGTP